MIRLCGSFRSLGAVSGWALVAFCLGALNLVSCQSQPQPTGEPAATAPADQPKAVELKGVNTSELTKREKDQWASYVTELLAPCPDVPVSIAECVNQSRPCDACLPGAKFLASQVTAGKSRSQAEAAYRLRFSADSVKEVEVGSSPSKGSSDAVVTIVEWVDFECPFCGMAAPMVGKMVKQFPGQVRVVFKHFPLPSHKHAESAARAATAAAEQGKFWEMHDALFGNQQDLSDKSIERLAKELGLDVKQFLADWRSEKVADLVAADRKQAEKLSLRGTPSIFVNGRQFDLEQFDLSEDLQGWVQLEIELRSGKKVKQATPPTAPDAPAKATGG